MRSWPRLNAGSGGRLRWRAVALALASSAVVVAVVVGGGGPGLMADARGEDALPWLLEALPCDGTHMLIRQPGRRA